MQAGRRQWRGMWLSAAGVLCAAVALYAEPPAGEPGAKPNKPAAKGPQVADEDRVSLEVARDRAKLMFDIYSTTLDVIHHRYFHREKSVIPARAMEDVFSEIRRQSKAEARWISVNTKAMSIDHEPETDFEKQAAAEIAGGKLEFETVEDGYYRRAGAIPLGGGCISCHGGFFREPSKTPKYAALVISVPVKADAAGSK